MVFVPLEVEPTKKEKDKEEVGFFESALAGVATGLWNIPKGVVSLGAELYDLVGDTNTAKEVEQWFDDVNPFDDEAEARTIGKITQALTQIGLPAYAGARVGLSIANKTAQTLAKKALAAKQANKYLSLSRVGAKIMSPTGRAVIGGGVGEALVADEDIGTFADIARGTSLEPFAITMMYKSVDKEARDEAGRRLLNRLKFGTEGALFNLALVGAGKGIQKLRKPTKGLDEFSKSSIGRDAQRYGPEYGFRPEGFQTKSDFEVKQFFESQQKATNAAASSSVKELDDAIKKVGDDVVEEFLEPRFKLKNTDQKRQLFREKLQRILKPNDPASIRLLKDDVRKTSLEKLKAIRTYKDLEKQLVATNADPKVVDKLNKFVEKHKDIGGKGVGIEDFAEKVRRDGIFNIKDYQKTKELKQLEDVLKKSSGVKGKDADEFASPLIKSLQEMRLAIDNMSSKTYLLGDKSETLDAIGNNFGRYMTTIYEKYEQQGLKFLDDFKTTNEMFTNSRKKYVEGAIKTARREYVDKQLKSLGRLATPDELAKFKQEAIENIYSSIDSIKPLVKEADETTKNYAKKIAADEVTPFKLKESDLSASDIANVKVDDNILDRQKLKEWQKELYGVIKDPSYTYFSTIGKQANLNFTTEYLNRMAQIGSAPGGFAKTLDQLDAIDPNLKTDATKWKKYNNTTSMPNDLDGLYIKAPQYEGILDVTSNWLNKSNVGTFYKYAVLAPKAASQIAKTILSPLTHVRNLISAGAFVSANGAFFPNYGDISMLLPKVLGGEGTVGKAYSLTGKRILGTLDKEQQKLYEKLLRVGVVDSQVQATETKRLLRDILKNPAAAERGLYNKLPKTITDRTKKGLLTTYQKLQDAYVAEDDFWKIINWSLERNRHGTIAKNLNITESNIRGILDNNAEAISSIGKTAEENAKIAKYFQDITPRKEYINTAQNSKELYENFLDEVAGNLTRNQVPNYAYVGRTARALRQTPFGNFIAFPLEILRTGNNILQRSLDEIYSGIPEIRSLGMKRLFSFGATVGGVPYGLVEMFKAKNDVTNEEMQALRKFVPEWSKNSTLLPMGRDENGYIKYVDFSYSNAYDTLIRPFNTVVNAISSGDTNKESTLESLGKGMQQGVAELLQPYTSESIFTEALVDSTIRRGIGRGGKQIWKDEDETMVKIGKGILHIGESLKPGSISQLKRLGEAATGKTGKYGQLYNLEDEIGSLYGFRTINSDPEKALTYMTTDLGNGLRDAESIFKSSLLKGGRITPEQIMNTYKYTQGIRYAKLKEMYSNIEAAKILGVPEYKIRQKVKRRGINKKTLSELYQGVYTPERPGDFSIKRIGEINRDLNEKEGVDMPNPFYEAIPSITNFINSNRRISLEGDNLNLMDFNQESQIGLLPSFDQQSNVNPIVNSPISGVGVNPVVLGPSGTNTALTKPFNQLSSIEKEQILFNRA